MMLIPKAKLAMSSEDKVIPETSSCGNVYGVID